MMAGFSTSVNAGGHSPAGPGDIVDVAAGNGSFNTLVAAVQAAELVDALKEYGREDIKVVCGGVIPVKDYEFLYQHGASAIFGPGTVIPDSAKRILELLLKDI